MANADKLKGFYMQVVLMNRDGEKVQTVATIEGVAVDEDAFNLAIADALEGAAKELRGPDGP